jgi:cytochrome c oxidase accessory protein FixG
MDRHSLTVYYDAKRGEPRNKRRHEKAGDCVDCFRCVSVCPVGIDIRRGQQLECIGCTACIDACDEVMDNVKKPRGLIRYEYLSRAQGEPHRWWRSSTVLYTVILALIGVGLVWSLAVREPVTVEVLRAKGAPFSDGGGMGVVNHFELEVNNGLSRAAEVQVSAVENRSSIKVVTGTPVIRVGESGTGRVDFFVYFPKEVLKNGHAKGALDIRVQSPEENFHFIKELPLVGPFH